MKAIRTIPFFLKGLALLSLMAAWSCQIMLAQETPVLVGAEARLENLLILRMTPERYVEFGIKKINDNLYQITKQPDDVMFSVESTGNWTLTLTSADVEFSGTLDSTSKVPLDFIGFYVENQGTNWDNGLFSNIVNATKDTIICMSPDGTTLLANGLKGNIGGSDENSFILRWKFFYEDNALRTRRFTDYNIADDIYRVGYYITLSESKQGKTDK